MLGESDEHVDVLEDSTGMVEGFAYRSREAVRLLPAIRERVSRVADPPVLLGIAEERPPVVSASSRDEDPWKHRHGRPTVPGEVAESKLPVRQVFTIRA